MKGGTLTRRRSGELERVVEAFLLVHSEGLRVGVLGDACVVSTDGVVPFGVVLSWTYCLSYMPVTDRVRACCSFSPIEYPPCFS